MAPEEMAAFSGSAKAGDMLLCAPQLLDYVKQESEKDAAILKNIRKAREERDARRPKKGPKKDE